MTVEPLASLSKLENRAGDDELCADGADAAVSYYVGIALVLVTALLEASVLPLFRVQGLQPNLTLVLLMAWLIVRGAEEAYVLIPIGGFFLGLVDGAPMGTALLALAPVALLQEVRGGQLNEKGVLIAIVFTAIMSLVYNYTYLAVFTARVRRARGWMRLRGSSCRRRS